MTKADDIRASVESLLSELEDIATDEEHVAAIEKRCGTLADAVAKLMAVAGVKPPSTGYNCDAGMAFLEADLYDALAGKGEK